MSVFSRFSIFFKPLVIVVTLLLSTSQLAHANPLFSKPILLEGIYDQYGYYNLLDIKEDGQHALYKVYLRGNLGVKRFPFSDDDIICQSNQCQINFDLPNEEATGQLILSPVFSDGPLLVHETAIDKDHNVILSASYQLKPKKGQSTPRDFIQRFKSRFQSLPDSDNKELAGLWLGTLNMEGQVDMLALEISEESKSHFIRYINGAGYTNETSFDFQDIQPFGDALFITTSHKTFANKILLHKVGKKSLSGYFYAYHKGVALQIGTFKLTKLTK